mmetsp:Transcript_88428/g.247346  ORF Transcript_88428/g.247346 Transcript_88428/m.247346 type:complete len:224 (+) Transcript_88428:105-776(+)
MRIRPARFCCCTCSLLKGVQLIASYTVLVGILSILTLLRKDGTGKAVASEPLRAAALSETAFHTIAFFVGLRALKAVVCCDARRLRTLLFYQVFDLGVAVFVFVVRWVEVCAEWGGLPHPYGLLARLPCGTRRLALVAVFAAGEVLGIHFAYVVWSLVLRIEAGELGPARDRPGAELADVLRAFEAAPPPFFGAPRRLGDVQGAIAGPPGPTEPFRGRSQRLG